MSKKNFSRMRGRHVSRRNPLKKGVAVFGVAGTAVLAGVLACGVALVTTAAFTDQANVNLGASTGIGSTDRFDIAVVGDASTPDAGKVLQADTDGGVMFPLPGGATLVPGSVLTSPTVIAFNNSKNHEAKLCLAVQKRDGIVPAATDISGLLTFTVFDLRSGTPVAVGAENRPLGAKFDLGKLKPRGSASLLDGDNYAAGGAGSESRFSVRVSYPDTDATKAFSSGQASLRLKLIAHSDAATSCS